MLLPVATQRDFNVIFGFLQIIICYPLTKENMCFELNFYVAMTDAQKVDACNSFGLNSIILIFFEKCRFFRAQMYVAILSWQRRGRRSIALLLTAMRYLWPEVRSIVLPSYGKMSMVRMLGQEHFVPSLNYNNVPITDSGKTGLPCKPPAQREQSMVLRSMAKYT